MTRFSVPRFVALSLPAFFLITAMVFTVPDAHAQEDEAGFEVLDVEEETGSAPQNEDAARDMAADMNGDTAEDMTASANAESDDVEAAKFALAKKIIAINPVEDDLNRTINQIAERVPANRRALFKSIMDRSIKIDRLNTAAQLAFTEVFTLAELEAMYAFYSSPEGQAVQNKMPQFNERINPVIESMVEDAMYNVRNSNINFGGR